MTTIILTNGNPLKVAESTEMVTSKIESATKKYSPVLELTNRYGTKPLFIPYTSILYYHT